MKARREFIGQAFGLKGGGWWILAAVGVLFAYTAARAILLAITHDEALSYLAIVGEYPDWTSNNHPLNSLGMRVTALLFGPSEWSLRLPSLAAHAGWLALSLLLIRRLESPLARIGGFALLNLSPFLLDFFSLARGYAMQVTAILASVYCLYRAIEEVKNRSTRIRLLWLAWIAATVADYSNFTAVDFHLPLSGVSVLLVLWDPVAKRLRLDFPTFAHACILGVAHAVVILSVVRRLLNLRVLKQLYDGSQSLREADIGSLVEPAHHGFPHPWWISAAEQTYLLGLGLAAGAFSLWRLARTRTLSPAAIVLAILTGAIAILVLQRWIFDALYPTERAALFLVPIAMAAIVLASIDAIACGGLARKSAIALLFIPALPACANFLATANLDHTHHWEFDKHNRTVAQLLDDRFRDEEDASVRIACNWLFEPGLNYYRLTRGLRWMKRVVKDEALRISSHEAVYCMESDRDSPDIARGREITRLPDAEAVLLDLRTASAE